MREYNHKDIEQKWQKKWEHDGIFHTPNTEKGKENFYMLTEFSYPSGNLHVGHWYAFAVSDMFARYKCMNGYNVLFPTGFDSFGLPAENAAIKRGLDPRKWTYENMDYMCHQLRSMGTMFDWSRAIATSDPDYYQWTQWMFTEFFKNDIAYRDTTRVNWCPSCNTVLANEQVSDGKCERCDSNVEQKDQDQWMLRITKYADQLHEDLEGLDWPTEIKTAQRAWIGRSEGAELSFKIKNQEKEVKVFTTRPDTLFGVTYVVLAPEHDLVQKLKDQITNWNDVESYILATQKKSELERQQDREKTGVYLEGVSVLHPITNEELPVWISDYVLKGYGTGAVMAVPAHDERDFAFAEKFGLPIKTVIEPQFVCKQGESAVHKNLPFIKRDAVCVLVRNLKDDTYLCIEWKNVEMHGLVTGGIEKDEDVIVAAIREVQEETGYKNLQPSAKQPNHAIHSLFYHRVKKQNRWARFQYVFLDLVDEERSEVSEEEAALHKVVWKKQEEMKDFFTVIEGRYVMKLLTEQNICNIEPGVLVNSGEFNGLTSEEAKEKITKAAGGEIKKTYRLRDWGISRQRYWGCPIPIVYDPNGVAHPVPAEHLPWLLPNDVDHTPDGTAPLARSVELQQRTTEIFGDGWTPEVETMDTFVDSSWYFYRYLDPKNKATFCDSEIMKQWMPINLYMGGAEHTTMHVLYSRFWNKVLYDLGYVTESEPYRARCNRGLVLGPDGNKMSKSKGNVIDPDEQVAFVGADTVRMYLAFIGPYGSTANYPWDPNGVVGIRRFLERVWRLGEKMSDSDHLESLLHETIRDVTADMERYKFNTVISKLMIFTNQAEKEGQISRTSYAIILRILAVLAPHIAEELWHEVLGEKTSVHLAPWPKYDESLIQNDVVAVPVQINGKVRVKLNVAPGISESDITSQALQHETVQKWLDGNAPKKIIYVPGKILNIVVV